MGVGVDGEHGIMGICFSISTYMYMYLYLQNTVPCLCALVSVIVQKLQT